MLSKCAKFMPSWLDRQQTVTNSLGLKTFAGGYEMQLLMRTYVSKCFILCYLKCRLVSQTRDDSFRGKNAPLLRGTRPIVRPPGSVWMIGQNFCCSDLLLDSDFGAKDECLAGPIDVTSAMEIVVLMVEIKL